ncbi:hypothetical protein AsACE_CH00165 [Acinetobacter schindleri]|nr:hypothetical protein AsACE_CH00165 [Acinetobacter schindleri]
MAIGFKNLRQLSGYGFDKCLFYRVKQALFMLNVTKNFNICMIFKRMCQKYQNQAKNPYIN